MLYRKIIVVCSQIHTKHKLTTGLQRTNRPRTTYSCTTKVCVMAKCIKEEQATI
jgi:hypothetical protein